MVLVPWSSFLHVILPMIEQPPKPDTPQAPDVVHKPGDVVNHPVPTGKPENETSPDVHPAPPPTDPSPPVI
jgi:hypothetical protein